MPRYQQDQSQRAGYPKFLTRRQQRAAYDDAVQMDALTRARNAYAQQAQIDAEAAKANFEYQKYVGDAARQAEYLRLQNLANARAEAKMADERAAQEQTTGAIQALTEFRADMPGAQTALSLLAAKYPMALSDPQVRDKYSKRLSQVEAMKTSLDLYRSETGGLDFPIAEDGSYDAPRAQARLVKTKLLNDARAQGILKSDEEAAPWRAMDEFDFMRPDTGFQPFLAGKKQEQGALAAASEYAKNKSQQWAGMAETDLKIFNALQPDMKDLRWADQKALDERRALLDAVQAKMLSAEGSARFMVGTPPTLPVAPKNPDGSAMTPEQQRAANAESFVQRNSFNAQPSMPVSPAAVPAAPQDPEQQLAP